MKSKNEEYGLYYYVYRCNNCKRLIDIGEKRPTLCNICGTENGFILVIARDIYKIKPFLFFFKKRVHDGYEWIVSVFNKKRKKNRYKKT